MAFETLREMASRIWELRVALPLQWAREGKVSFPISCSQGFVCEAPHFFSNKRCSAPRLCNATNRIAALYRPLARGEGRAAHMGWRVTSLLSAPFPEIGPPAISEAESELECQHQQHCHSASKGIDSALRPT